MRLRSTLLLLLILVGLGSYVYLVELPKAEQADEKEKLFRVTAGDVTEIHLAFADRSIRAQRSAGGWQLVEPIQGAGDKDSIEALLSGILGAEIKKTLDGPASDLARYGLEAPLVTVTLKTATETLPAFALGKDTPVGGSAYLLRKDPDKVALTSSSLRFSLDKQVKDLRDKKLIEASDDDVRWIEIKGRNDVRLVRDDKGGWQLERPAPFRADESAVRTYLSSLRALRAADFADDAPSDLKPFGLDEPRLVVSVGLNGDATKRISFGATKETDVYAQVEGKAGVVTVSDASFRNVDKFARDLRDKTIVSVDKLAITAVSVEREGAPAYRISKTDSGTWQIEGNQDPLKSGSIDQFVTDLTELKGYEIEADNPPSLVPFKLDQPRLKITIHGPEGPLSTVRVGETEGADGIKHFNTMTEGGSTVFLLRSYILSRIDKAIEDFLDKPAPAADGGAAPKHE